MSRFILTTEAVRANAIQAVRAADNGMVVEIKQPTRSTEQNARLWASLNDIASQIEWYGQKLSAEDYKDMLTASYRKARVVPGIDNNGFVVLGLRTSKMTKAELSDLLEIAYAFGTERGVVFHDPQSEGFETRT